MGALSSGWRTATRPSRSILGQMVPDECNASHGRLMPKMRKNAAYDNMHVLRWLCRPAVLCWNSTANGAKELELSGWDLVKLTEG